MAVAEPRPPDPSRPRYSDRPFPSYRFVPGQSPHPRRDPRGHSFEQAEPGPILLPPGEWRRSNEYLYGIDLYNHAYWWECHEVFERLWHKAGHETEQGNFFKAIIQLAAMNLKCFIGNHQAAENLALSGITRLEMVPDSYMGVDVAGLIVELRQRTARSHWYAPSIRLDVPDRESGEALISGQ